MKRSKKSVKAVTSSKSTPLEVAPEILSAEDIQNIPATKKLVASAENPSKKFINQLMRDRPDIAEDYLYKCLIDHSKYIAKYKDIANSEMHAAEHYFTYGHIEKRDLPKPGLQKHPQPFNILSETTLFLSSAELRDGSFIYRCLFQSLDYPQNLVYTGKTEVLKLVRAVFNCKELIFSRPEKTDLAFYLIELAKNIGVKVTLDYDDLLLPEHAEYLGHVRSSDGLTIEEARKSLINKSAFLLYADAFHCSTPAIAKALANLEKPVKVVKNRIMRTMVASDSTCISRLENIETRKLKILYLSGTATHKRDFSIIQGTIVKLAQEFPDKFEMTFLGNTGSNVHPIAMYNSNIHVIPRLTLNEMYKVIAQHDLALAPLEDTIFNSAKSNIKFIECGSQGVPIIASPLNEFKNVIVDDENGWLCNTQSEWYEKLKSLIINPTPLRKVSLEARNCVINNFTVG
ncbi:glycosyltransferase [Pseudomonas abietaniphila]|uniref:glycosyltransferase n=1 Tax=Pseudomonas abietaniphila TaxID=89065 RepID=UPI003216B351